MNASHEKLANHPKLTQGGSYGPFGGSLPSTTNESHSGGMARSGELPWCMMVLMNGLGTRPFNMYMGLVAD